MSESNRSGRTARGLLTRSVAVLYPPARFDGEREALYRAATNRGDAKPRQAALMLVLVIWVAFVGWDLLHERFGTVTISREMIAARAVGIVAIVAAIPLLRIGRVPAVALLNTVAVIVYACALAGMALVGFPTNYLLYMSSLPLFMLVTFGLFRLPARSVAAIATVELLLSYLVLSLPATWFDFSNSAKGDVVLLSAVAAANPKYGRGLIDVPKGEGPYAYMAVATLLFLLVVAVVGIVIAVEREKLSRETFLREHELLANYAQLQASERATATKTTALVEAQSALRATAERRNLEKTVFLRNLAHDLRNALAVVSLEIAAVRDALGPAAPGRSRAALDNAGEATDLAARTLRSVLEIASLESDQVTPDYTSFALAPVLRAAVVLGEGPAAQRGVRIRVRPAAAAIAVRSDRNLLERLIGNLLSNAIKYSNLAKGARQQVLLGAVVYPTHVRVDVVDNGIGIAREQWTRVFQPFVQLDNPQRDRDRGVGLGLSIASGIVDRLAEHRLDMRSHPGRGTRFSIEVPRAPDLVPHGPSPAAPATTDTLAQGYAIFVEDDAKVREATAALLARAGMLCEAFAGYAELAAELPEIERVPDVILTDYRLPDLHTGTDVIDAVRARFGPDVPALIFTGEIGTLAMRQVAGRRPHVLLKPVPADDLLQALAAAIRPAAG